MERHDDNTTSARPATAHTGDETPLGAVGQKERRPKSRAARAAQDVITGDFMGYSRLRRWYPLALYCILLVFLYIGHVFNFQRLQRLEIQQRMELNNDADCRSKSRRYRPKTSGNRPSDNGLLPTDHTTQPPKKEQLSHATPP